MKKIMLIISLVLSLAACKNRGGESKVPNLKDEITISGLSDDRWTYFSFESGEVVGQSSFASEEEDALWAERKDWDLAICGEHIKTNGGTSGNGAGGIQRDKEKTFQSLEEAPLEDYLTDTLFVVK